MKPHELIKKAETSVFYRKMLNLALYNIIPFNKPHRPRIEKITPEAIEISLPYRRRNLNHLKGLHACALAALSEFTCGLMLIRNLPAGEFRLIMKELQMTYHYQGKTKALTNFSIPHPEIAAIKKELTTSEAVFRTFEVETNDILGNHLCTARITWQLKNWKSVKTSSS